MQRHRSRSLRRVRRHERGAVAIETALSLLILTFLMTALFNFGHAMFVRQQLTTITSTTARACALSDPATAEACVDQTLNAQLARQGFADDCRNLDIQTRDDDIDGIEVLGVQVTCGYIGGPWARFLATRLPDMELNLTANAVMPRR
jgi:Flp pilus assembly pilin Flp